MHITASGNCIRSQKGLVLQYQVHNRVENLPTFRPDVLVFFGAKRRQGFQLCCEAGIGEPILSDA